VRPFEIKTVLWLFVSILIALGALGFASRADLQPNSSVKRTDEPLQAAHWSSAVDTAPPPPPTSPSPLPGSSTTRELAPPHAEPATESLLAGPTSGLKCPLSRVAMVRGSDSEASEGGGFYAARRNGIHGAVDLNGSVGEAVFAVANGKVVVAARSDWGKLGKTVILDHLDGGYTIYGHLDTVEVDLHSNIASGSMIGTIGYSGNAKSLKRKSLPPHLHFAYVRAFAGTGSARPAPLARIKSSGEGLRSDFAADNSRASVFHPRWAVGFLKCWEDPTPAMVPSTPSTLATP
jgi:murein DD-endopeptidase MepM/ murein hydrolase activator NlpD